MGSTLIKIIFQIPDGLIKRISTEYEKMIKRKNNNYTESASEVVHTS